MFQLLDGIVLTRITCGDNELAEYIRRLMALSITGLALHLLIIFHGRGRNGKGVLLRLIEKILGRELFAIALRPEDVEIAAGPRTATSGLWEG